MQAAFALLHDQRIGRLREMIQADLDIACLDESGANCGVLFDALNGILRQERLIALHLRYMDTAEESDAIGLKPQCLFHGLKYALRGLVREAIPSRDPVPSRRHGAAIRRPWPSVRRIGGGDSLLDFRIIVLLAQVGPVETHSHNAFTCSWVTVRGSPLRRFQQWTECRMSEQATHDAPQIGPGQDCLRSATPVDVPAPIRLGRW